MWKISVVHELMYWQENVPNFHFVKGCMLLRDKLGVVWESKYSRKAGCLDFEGKRVSGNTSRWRDKYGGLGVVSAMENCLSSQVLAFQDYRVPKNRWNLNVFARLKIFGRAKLSWWLLSYCTICHNRGLLNCYLPVFVEAWREFCNMQFCFYSTCQ